MAQPRGPPAGPGSSLPGDLDAFLATDPPLTAIVHLGAVSETTATDADLAWQTNVELSLRLWHWCAMHGVRLIYASSAATYGDGALGFEDDGSITHLDRLRPLNLYGWTKNAFDLRIARLLAAGAPRPPQWAGLKFFNVYGPERVSQGADDLGRQGQARRARVRPAAPTVPCRPAGHGGRRAAARLHLGRRCGGRDAVACSTRRRRTACSTSAPAWRAATSIWRTPSATLPARPRHVTFVDLPPALRGQYQSFTQASTDRLRAAGYAGQFTPLEEGIRRYVQNHLSRPDPLPMIPVLMFPQFDPVLVQVGPFAIRWYAPRLHRRDRAGLAAAAPADRAGTCRRHQAASRRLRHLGDAWHRARWAGLATCCSTSPASISRTRPRSWRVWHGGMSFHGGAIGVTIAIIIFCYRNRIPILGFADRLAVLRADRPRLRPRRQFHQRRIMGPRGAGLAALGDDLPGGPRPSSPPPQPDLPRRSWRG